MGEVISLTEAVRRYRIGEKTLLKWIRATKEVGSPIAEKKPDEQKRLVWHIDTDNLENLIRQKYTDILTSDTTNISTRIAATVPVLDPISGHSVQSSLSKEQITALAAELSYQQEIIEALKQEIEALRERVGVLEQTSRKSRPARRFVVEDVVEYKVPKSTAKESQEGAMAARTFAVKHGKTRDLMEGWIRRGEITATPVDLGKGRTQNTLTIEQQSAVIQFWQQKGVPYKACPDCPHQS